MPLSKSDCRLIINDYFDELINLLNYKEFNENTLKLKCKLITDNINTGTDLTELEYLIATVNPLYIISHDNEIIELIEVSKDCIYPKIINNYMYLHQDISSIMFLIPKLFNIDTYIRELLNMYRNECITNMYIHLKHIHSPLIEDPNKFISLCCDVDTPSETHKNCLYELYKSIDNKNKIDFNSLFENCDESDILGLFELVVLDKDNIDMSKCDFNISPKVLEHYF